jgi:phage gpG-like protein
MSKGATECTVSIGKHTVNMPAGPYLGIRQADDQEIRGIINWIVGRTGK